MPVGLESHPTPRNPSSTSVVLSAGGPSPSEVASMNSPQTLRLPLLIVPLVMLTVRAAAGDLSGKEIYQQTVRATAWVSTARGTGSGWLLDRDRRLLVTSYHVV